MMRLLLEGGFWKAGASLEWVESRRLEYCGEVRLPDDLTRLSVRRRS